MVLLLLRRRRFPRIFLLVEQQLSLQSWCMHLLQLLLLLLKNNRDWSLQLSRGGTPPVAVLLLLLHMGPHTPPIY